MEKKKAYTCAICGKEYEAIPERAKCEMTCLDKQATMKAKEMEEKKKQEQEARRQEVAAAINYASEVLDAYIDDYGSFTYSSVVDMVPEAADDMTEKETETVSKTEVASNDSWFDGWPFTSRLFHHFW